MAAVSTFIAAAALVVSAVGVQQQMSAQKQQAKQFKESQALTEAGQKKQQEATDLQTMRSKRAAVREAQIRRSEVEANAARSEVGGSSPIQGARGSLQTQAGGQVSFLDSMNKTTTAASTLFGQANAVGNRPVSNWGPALSSIGGTLFSGADKIGNIFSSASNWMSSFNQPAPTAMNNYFDGN